MLTSQQLLEDALLRLHEMGRTRNWEFDVDGRIRTKTKPSRRLCPLAVAYNVSTKDARVIRQAISEATGFNVAFPAVFDVIAAADNDFLHDETIKTFRARLVGTLIMESSNDTP